jgi:hypothetical protein
MLIIHTGGKLQEYTVHSVLSYMVQIEVPRKSPSYYTNSVQMVRSQQVFMLNSVRTG